MIPRLRQKYNLKHLWDLPWVKPHLFPKAVDIPAAGSYQLRWLQGQKPPPAESTPLFDTCISV